MQIDHGLAAVAAFAMHVLEQVQRQRARAVEQQHVALLQVVEIAGRDLARAARSSARAVARGTQRFRVERRAASPAPPPAAPRSDSVSSARERLEGLAHHATSIGVLALACGAPNRLVSVRAVGAAVAEGEAAGAAQVEGVLGDLAMRGRDDEAILVVGDRHDLVHVLDLLRRSGRRAAAMVVVDHAVDGLGAHVGAHRQHALERRARPARSSPAVSRLARYLQRDAQRAHVGHLAVDARSCRRRPPTGSATAAARTRPSAACGIPGCSGKATFHSIAIF